MQRLNLHFRKTNTNKRLLEQRLPTVILLFDYLGIVQWNLFLNNTKCIVCGVTSQELILQQL